MGWNVDEVYVGFGHVMMVEVNELSLVSFCLVSFCFVLFRFVLFRLVSGLLVSEKEIVEDCMACYVVFSGVYV